MAESHSFEIGPGRRLDDAALPGTVNMGRDEALLHCRLQPTLRFYRWLRPTVSLGRFQSARSLPLDSWRARGCDVVRRATGGKAIHHHHELTYSLCLPEQACLPGGPAAAMRSLHEAIAAALEAQLPAPVSLREEQSLLSDQPGSAWCFQDSSPLDLTTGGRKLLGSAARRRGGWMLIHGSLIETPPAGHPDSGSLGHRADPDALAEALGQHFGLDFCPGRWRQEELRHADSCASHYAAREWVHRL